MHPLLARYATFHADKRNRALHEVRIPLILLALTAFVVGWIFRFVGHAYEGKRTTFLGNLVHLLVGPLWIGVILSTRCV